MRIKRRHGSIRHFAEPIRLNLCYDSVSSVFILASDPRSLRGQRSERACAVRAVLRGEVRSQIDRIRDQFWSGGISNPLEVIEQITYLLFMRRLRAVA